MDLLGISILGFVTKAGGMIIGSLMMYLFHIKSDKIIGMLFGAASGLMIAMICFDVLPEALSSKRMDLVLVGVGIGVLMGLLLDEVGPWAEKRWEGENIQGAALGLLIGLAIHLVPEGFSLGTVGHLSKENIQSFAFILWLHSIPEGIVFVLSLGTIKLKLKDVIVGPVILGGILSGSAAIGFMLSSISEMMIVTALGVAAGIILYIVCEELMPESRKVWNGRRTTLATILGIVMGLLLIYKG